MEIPSLATYERALQLRAQRNDVLSTNIANADTPNYKARDLDFSQALQGAQRHSLAMTATSEQHLQGSGMTTRGDETLYRVPVQPSLDGNTVSIDVEQANFAENALQYRASLAFLDGSIRTLRMAIKGGQ